MALHSIADPLVVSIGRVLEGGPKRLQAFHCAIDVAGAQRDMLDAFAAIKMQVFLDLRFVVGGFVDRNADLAVRTGHRAGLQAGQLALDIEVPNFPEVKQLLVETGPLIHVAAIDVVGDVIDLAEPDAVVREPRARVGRHKVDVVDRMLAVTVDQIDHAAADAFDGRDVKFHRPDLVAERLGASGDQLCVRGGRILDPERHGTGARSVRFGETAAVTVGFGVDDEVHIALAKERDRFGTMSRHRAKPHVLEQAVQLAHVGRGVLDELETVGADRILPEILRH